MTKHIPFHHDHVRSFLRPQSVKDAREAFKNGSISAEDLKAVENEAITQVVAKQKELGYQSFTDGEFRRESYLMDFMWDFDGIAHRPTTEGMQFEGKVVVLQETYLTGKLGFSHHSFIEHYSFLKQFETEDFVAKVTVPASAHFFLILSGHPATKDFYPDTEELVADVARIYREFLAAIYAAGCRNIQYDDTSWGAVFDDKAAQQFFADDENVHKAIMETFLAVDNLSLEGKPADLAVATHVCRGNHRSTYLYSGSYDKISEVLFARENVDAFYLEFDDERSGGFESLAQVSGDKKVVLGLVTSKLPELEDKEAIISRIKEASQSVF